MATQYTPILQLALPVTGELNGTWGDVVNDNITSMVEEAIAGLATINTWTANSHTLTTADGVTDEARCAMLVAATGSGGTALSAAGEIICPARTKLFVLQNSSSYQVTLKTASGTGIAVAAGDTAFLFCDGTNVNACVTQIINGHITGNLTVDGNATVNGNTTLGNSTSDTITATARVASDLNPSVDNTYDLGTSGNSWRNLYIDGTATIATLNVTTIDTTNLEVTNIKAQDGTAAITLAGSTGVATFTANPILNAATANGVAYLNGSKVLTTGSALTFDGTNLTLGATGALLRMARLTDGGLTGSLGSRTSGNFSLYNSGGSSTEITVAANDIRFDIGASEQMRLTSTGLGIGTSSPAAKLNVQATGIQGLFQYDASNQILVFHSGSNGYFGTFTNQPLILRTNNTDRVTIDTSGNLGLGVPPSAWGSGRTALQLGGTASYVMANSLFVAGANNYYNGTGNIYIGNGYATQYHQNSGQHQWFTAPSGTAGNAITFTQAMTLDASGNLGIGTSSPGAKLHINAGRVYIDGNNEQYSLRLAYNNSTSGVYLGSPSANTFTVADNAGTERMRIDSSGNLGLGVTPSAVSGKVFEIGAAGHGIAYRGAADINLTQNAYWSSGAWYYGSTTGVGSSAYQQVDGAHRWYTAPSGTAGNAISFTQAMTLDASGNLLVGTTSAGSSGVGPLFLNKATNPGYVLSHNGTERAYQYMPSSTRYRGETVTGVAIEFSAGNSNGVSLSSGGTSWGSLSDERKKDIIEPITDAANKVSTLRAVIGKYKTDEKDSRRVFLIAQDVQSVLPEAVVQNENDDLILQYTEVIPLLVAAIKEQQELINQLTARVAQLEGN